MPVIAGHQADLDMFAALAQVGDGVEAGGLAAEGVNGDMNTASAYFDYSGGNIFDFSVEATP